VNNYFVRRRAALNPNTSTETLDRLADDKDGAVRYEVAWNPHTLPETLESLANDDDWYVRCAVAFNPNTPQYIKTYLKITEVLNYYE